MGNPVYKEPWAKCQTCGIDVPRSKIRLHPRFGWQCIARPGLICWDGLLQGDEYHYIPRPYEGVRKTAAPLTGTATEGIATVLYFQDLVLSDTYWQVSFGDTVVVNSSVAIYNAIRGMYCGNGWYFTMQSGAGVLTQVVPTAPITNPIGMTMSADAGGVLTYVPPS